MHKTPFLRQKFNSSKRSRQAAKQCGLYKPDPSSMSRSPFWLLCLPWVPANPKASHAKNHLVATWAPATLCQTSNHISAILAPVWKIRFPSKQTSVQTGIRMIYVTVGKSQWAPSGTPGTPFFPLGATKRFGKVFIDENWRQPTSYIHPKNQPSQEQRSDHLRSQPPQ